MKILQLSNKIPFPPLDGGSIVINNVTHSLHQLGCEVHLLAVDTPKRPIPAEAIPDQYRKMAHLQTVTIDTRLRPLDALRNLIFSKLPYHVSRYASTEFEIKLTEILTDQNFDVVQVESLYMMIYVPTIRKHSKALVVLRAQNIEHRIWAKQAENLIFSLKKWYLTLQTRRLRRFELESWKKADGCVAITTIDEKGIKDEGIATPTIAVPLGIEIEKYPMIEASAPQKNSIFHLGSMDWMPNLEAIEWFLEKIWPIVQERSSSEIPLFLAGKHMPNAILSLNDQQMTVENQINDPVVYMRDKAIMVVPLRSGSGIRVKILEGMAMGKTIISTRIGAEGIQCTNGLDILLADTPEDFAEAILLCQNNLPLLEVIGKNARKLIETQYNQDVLANHFLKFYALLPYANIED